MGTPRSPRVLGVAAVVLALSLSACGQGAGQPATTPAPSETPTVAATAPAEVTPEATPASPPAASPESAPPAPPAPPPTTPPPASQDSTDMADWTLTTAGWGPVRIGSPLPADLRDQLKPSWECIGPIITDSRGNERMEFFTGQANGSGPINTLHIVSPSVSTRAGIRPGDPLEKMIRTYPKASRFRAPADQGGDVYILRDGDYGLFFEVKNSDRTVEHISVQPVASFMRFQLQICGGP